MAGTSATPSKGGGLTGSAPGARKREPIAVGVEYGDLHLPDICAATDFGPRPES